MGGHHFAGRGHTGQQRQAGVAARGADFARVARADTKHAAGVARSLGVARRAQRARAEHGLWYGFGDRLDAWQRH